MKLITLIFTLVLSYELLITWYFPSESETTCPDQHIAAYRETWQAYTSVVKGIKFSHPPEYTIEETDDEIRIIGPRSRNPLMPEKHYDIAETTGSVVLYKTTDTFYDACKNFGTRQINYLDAEPKDECFREGSLKPSGQGNFILVASLHPRTSELNSNSEIKLLMNIDAKSNSYKNKFFYEASSLEIGHDKKHDVIRADVVSFVPPDWHPWPQHCDGIHSTPDLVVETLEFLPHNQRQ